MKMPYRYLPFLTALCALCTSCVYEPLSVHTDYISHTSLASSYVGTPDPVLQTALAGQRLVVSWWIPPTYQGYSAYEIRIKARFGNKEEIELLVPVEQKRGWYVYALANEEYFLKNGIKTYYVQFYAEDQLIDEWKHQLWVELIEFPVEEGEGEVLEETSCKSI